MKLPFVSKLVKNVSAPKESAQTDLDLRDRIDAMLVACSIKVSFSGGEERALEKIPPLGRLIVLSNDPLPGLSTLAVLSLLARSRKDIRVIAERNTAWLESFKDITIVGEDLVSVREQARQHLALEGVLFIQPVHFGESKGVPKLTQERWPTEFLTLGEHTLSPLLHIHISSDELPFLQQVRGLYRGNGLLQSTVKRFMPSSYGQKLVVGELIDASDYKDLNLRDKFKAKLLRKQLYRVAEGKRSYFKTLPSIAAPESRASLRSELDAAELLGETKDRKLIFLCDLNSSSSLLKEIGRLRELSFRVVGEGSGKACDIDEFDPYYQHIVLWDAQDREVVGAYRLRATDNVEPHHLYTSTLMTYQEHAAPTLARGVELGRSFVQPKYWGSRSLDYLWTGIAAYIRRNPRVRYLFGAVSISNAFSQQAKDLMLGYYMKYYYAEAPFVACMRPYLMAYDAMQRNEALFEGLTAKEAFVVLREQLGLIGHSVPTLYKQYTELCDDGGALFHGFNIDPDFQDCIDGLVVVDLHRLKPLKRKRYQLEQHDFLAYEQTNTNGCLNDGEC